jgi:hypothetical protein
VSQSVDVDRPMLRAAFEALVPLLASSELDRMTALSRPADAASVRLSRRDSLVLRMAACLRVVVWLPSLHGPPRADGCAKPAYRFNIYQLLTALL